MSGCELLWNLNVDAEYLPTCPYGSPKSHVRINHFLLVHQRADDEALIRLPQITLFRVASPILVKSMTVSFKS